ncbi:unnamed protein product [Sphagnum troendelagicum]|uniref:Uncharacterized protein n=1 Tax=Sphagnum jensenii TaxID=128206 RepID=A0ABP0XGV2_9BRYO
MELVGLNYPEVHRKKSLPQPKEKENSVSLWSMIKDNIGKDLSKICLPVYFNEPISSLQRCPEDVDYSYLLHHAYEYFVQICKDFHVGPILSYKTELAMLVVGQCMQIAVP